MIELTLSITESGDDEIEVVKTINDSTATDRELIAAIAIQKMALSAIANMGRTRQPESVIHGLN